jgi:hypothetical protein
MPYLQVNCMPVRCLLSTGQIQNFEDFFEAGKQGMPPRNCLKRGFEFGAPV